MVTSNNDNNHRFIKLYSDINHHSNVDRLCRWASSDIRYHGNHVNSQFGWPLIAIATISSSLHWAPFWHQSPWQPLALSLILMTDFIVLTVFNTLFLVCLFQRLLQSFVVLFSWLFCSYCSSMARPKGGYRYHSHCSTRRETNTLLITTSEKLKLPPLKQSNRFLQVPLFPSR